MKSCATCVFYERAKDGYSSGTCEYPVPEYLKVNGFVGAPEYSGTRCATHKSRVQLAQAIIAESNIEVSK